jgi:hypothetical protein
MMARQPAAEARCVATGVLVINHGPDVGRQRPTARALGGSPSPEHQKDMYSRLRKASQDWRGWNGARIVKRGWVVGAGCGFARECRVAVAVGRGIIATSPEPVRPARAVAVKRRRTL